MIKETEVANVNYGPEYWMKFYKNLYETRNRQYIELDHKTREEWTTDELKRMNHCLELISGKKDEFTKTCVQFVQTAAEAAAGVAKSAKENVGRKIQTFKYGEEEVDLNRLAFMHNDATIRQEIMDVVMEMIEDNQFTKEDAINGLLKIVKELS